MNHRDKKKQDQQEQEQDEQEQDEQEQEEDFDENIYALLDSSTLKEYYILTHNNSNADLAREPMSALSASSIYINERGRITRIAPFRIELGENAVLSHTTIYKIVADSKNTHPSFALTDIVVFNVTLESRLIPHFVSTDLVLSNGRRRCCHNRDKSGHDDIKNAFLEENKHALFFSSVIASFVQESDVVVEPSLIFFHKVNHIYFFFSQRI